MKVSEAVQRRVSIRAFRPERPSAEMVRGLLKAAARAPSGGNLQPWKVYALTGAPLEDLKARAAANPLGETPEYDVYPPNLWDPFRTRRFQNGEDLYATIGIPREDKAARLRYPKTVAEVLGLPDDHMLFSGMALGWRDEAAPINTLRSARDPFEVWGELRGF